jgi:phosphatidylglycerol:prolipoprotein diacylglycerol transferase
MHPYIIIGSFRLPSYGVMLVLAGAALCLGTLRRGKRRGQSGEDLFSLLSMGLVGAIVGAKLLFLAGTIPELIKMEWHGSFREFLGLLSGGFVFYGGLLGAALSCWLFARKYKMDLLPLLDTAAPFLPLAHAVGRVGCFLAGCCYGRPAAPPWGVDFGGGIGGAPAGVTLLPVQLYEAAANVLIALLLFHYGRKERPAGRTTLLYILLYAAARFVLEFFRGDEVRGIFVGLSTSQWIALATAGAALWFLRRLRGRQDA